MSTVIAHKTNLISKTRGVLPTSWKKAAGILRGRKPDPVKELQTMRKEWHIRMKTLEKRSRA